MNKYDTNRVFDKYTLPKTLAIFLFCTISSLCSMTLNAQCGPGEYYDSDTEQCLICPAGSYCPGDSMKYLCEAGTFSNIEGAESCMPCDKGSAAATMGATSCGLCPAGTFTSDIGSINCLNCPPGKYSAVAGSISCASCLPGTFSSEFGATACTRCPAGSAAPDSGSTQCALCPAGKFSANEGSTACTICPAGKISPNPGATMCSSCDNGISNEENTECIECLEDSDCPDGYICSQDQTCIPESVDLVVNCPDDITDYVDSGICCAELTIALPQSNNPIETIVNDYNNSDDASDLYYTGETVVTWTITDIYGNVETCIQKITLIDDQAPVFGMITPECVGQSQECLDIKVDIANRRKLFDQELEACNDDQSCILRITNELRKLDEQETKLIVRCMIDEGCHIERFESELPPIEVNITTDECEAFVQPLVFVTDNCSQFSLINDYNFTASSDDFYPVGTTLITYTATDQYGNVSNATQEIIVSRDYPPAFYDINQSCAIKYTDCIGNKVQVFDGEIEGLKAQLSTCTDIQSCKVIKLRIKLIEQRKKLEIKKCEVRSRCSFINTTQNLSGIDTLIVNRDCEIFLDPRVVPADNCARLTVTNDFTGSESAAAFYPIGTTIIIWTVTDEYGQSSTAAMEITVGPDEPCGAASPCKYVILAEDEVQLHDTDIQSGGVGVIGNNRKAKIQQSSTVVGSSTFVNANRVQINGGSTVETIIDPHVSVALPEFIPFINLGGFDLSVPNNASVLLTEMSYDKLDIGENTNVTFSGHSKVYISYLKVERNATIHFDQCTDIISNKSIQFKEGLQLNVGGTSKVSIYSEKHIKVNEGSNVQANFYALDNINIDGKNGQPTSMQGHYYTGKKIDAKENVTFSITDDCLMPCVDNNPNVVHCQVGEWSDWSECSAPCGGGTRVRTRSILVQPSNGGLPCPAIVEEMPCNEHDCDPGDCEDGLISFDNFESGWGTWVDGGSDASRISSSALEGVKVIRLRDNSGYKSGISTGPYNLENNTSIQLSFLFCTVNFSGSEDFLFEMSTDNGQNWTVLRQWIHDVDFNNVDVFSLQETIDGVSFSDETKFRFRADASSNADKLYIDSISISKVCDISSIKSELTKVRSLNLENIINEEYQMSIYDLEISPNPVSDHIIMTRDEPFEENTFMEVFNIQGQSVMTQKLNQNRSTHRINVSRLPDGVYLIKTYNDKGDYSINKIMISK